MDLKSSHPFWLLQDGLLNTYPPLEHDVDCDVAIIGAGVTGALAADALTSAGFDVVVVDARDVGQGSTSASTSLLQYEIDTHLRDLIEIVGREAAERAYRLCLESIDQLEAKTGELADSGGFSRRRSLYVASRDRDVAVLRDEYEARRDCRIRVDLLDGPEVREQFGVDCAAALLSYDAAVCNAYRLAHALLQRAKSHGARIFDRTCVSKFDCQDSGVCLHTDRRSTVSSRAVVFATGYESQQYLRERVVRLKSTYAMVTQPLDSTAPWPEDALFWESSRPYLYMRTTTDRRILAGGEDDNFRNAVVRDRRVDKKASKILQRVESLLPNLRVEVEHAWAGTFGETKDGLAYIGPSPEHPHAYFALGFGGNGITFSVVAADILVDLLSRRQNADAAIFRFGR